MHTVIAVRQFELEGNTIWAWICAPNQADNSEFRCQWFVEWPERRISRYACGQDGVQALLGAFRMLHGELLSSEAYAKGQLTFMGDTDLGLPSLSL